MDLQYIRDRLYGVGFLNLALFALFNIHSQFWLQFLQGTHQRRELVEIIVTLLRERSLSTHTLYMFRHFKHILLAIDVKADACRL